ncbi:MAG: DUF6089 family protein [Tannerella sp.]|nr:DUF6089 family protein [Tannerella sp.]
MNLTFFRRISILLLLCLSFFRVGAQEYLYEIGGMLGGAFYMGDANKNAAFKNMNPAASLLFRYNLNFRVAFKANLAWARVTGSTEGLDNVFPNRAQVDFNRNVIDLGGQAEFNFFPYSDKYQYLQTKRIAPYIMGGLGLSFAPGGGATFFSPHISAGTGVKYKIKNRINIGAELSMRKLFGDGLDINGENELLNDPYGMGGGIWKNKDWYSMLMISVSYDFGLRNCNCNKKDMNEIY